MLKWDTWVEGLRQSGFEDGWAFGDAGAMIRKM